MCEETFKICHSSMRPEAGNVLPPLPLCVAMVVGGVQSQSLECRSDLPTASVAPLLVIPVFSPHLRNIAISRTIKNLTQGGNPMTRTGAQNEVTSSRPLARLSGGPLLRH